MKIRAAIYLRVSTSEQTSENQRRDLAAAAERRGWSVVSVFSDNGVSGSTSRSERPGLDAMLKAAVRGEFDVVMCWSVDRLGRSVQHVANVMAELKATGVTQYYHQQGLDTSTPYGEAMLQMAVVFAELERKIIVERVRAGLARARAEGTRLGSPKGAVAEKVKHQDRIVALRANGVSIRKIADLVGVSPATVQKALRRAPGREIVLTVI